MGTIVAQIIKTVVQLGVATRMLTNVVMTEVALIISHGDRVFQCHLVFPAI
jgi:hypothetical protein